MSKVIVPYQENWELSKEEKHLLPAKILKHMYDYDVVVLHNARRSTYGVVNNRHRNILVWNFWQMLGGYLADEDADMITTTVKPLSFFYARTSGDANASSCYITFGTDTTPPSFSDYVLQSRDTTLEGSVLEPSFVVEPDRIRIRFRRQALGTVYEIGLYQKVYNDIGRVYEVMHGRAVVQNGLTGNVYYDIVLKEPFLENLARVIYGYLTDTDQNIIDVLGQVRTVKTSGELNFREARLELGSGSDPFSFSQYKLTNMYELTWDTKFEYGERTDTLIFLADGTRFETDYNINEIGIIQPLYDTDGFPAFALIMRYLPTSPIQKKAGEKFYALVAIYASI